MPMRAWAAAAAVSLLGGVLLGSTGCATTARKVYTPAELRAALVAHPGIPASDVVVPYELPPEALEKARQLVRHARSDGDKVEWLVKGMFDPAIFGLRLDSVNAVTTTTTGAEALAAGQGNCVALASVFIGLARSVGLDARYVDASSRVHERRYGEDGGAVHVGHVTALVNTGNERISLDFARVGPFVWYQELDDLEALAHLYNNRGYELVELARETGEAPDWAEAERHFRLAVAVKPGFARAWNNIGIAAARQGRPAEAMESYRRASALDPKMAAPHANLGAMHLQGGYLPAALGELDAAARLDPKGAHIQYNLALARLRSGDLPGAIAALRRTLTLRGTYPGAQALMDRLAPGSPGAGGG
jgi:tetratricopeptide (TPR) repeat protein